MWPTIYGANNTLIFIGGVGMNVNSTELKYYDSCYFHFWDTYKDKWSTATQTDDFAMAISITLFTLSFLDQLCKSLLG